MELDNEIKDLEDEASEAEEAFDTISVEEATDELRYQTGLRIKFWKATLPSGGQSLDMEDWEGLADYDEAISRYSEFARHFKVPSNKQISDILAKLDADFPDWDRTQPDQFYSTLGTLLPDLMRRERFRQRANKSGVGCRSKKRACRRSCHRRSDDILPHHPHSVTKTTRKRSFARLEWVGSQIYCGSYFLHHATVGEFFKEFGA